MKVLIGTTNPNKIEGAKEALSNYFKDFEIEGIKVPSGVSEEPVNDDIYKGALNRVNNLINYAKENNIDAQYFLGVESGITNSLGAWGIVSIAVIKDKNGIESFGTSPMFPVPIKYVDEIINTDLCKIMDKLFNQTNVGHGKGGICFLTHGVIDRTHLNKEAFVMALTKYINEEKWKD